MKLKLITTLLITTTSLTYGSLTGIKKIETNKISKELHEKMNNLNYIDQQLDSYYVTNDDITVIKYDKTHEITQLIKHINLDSAKTKAEINHSKLKANVKKILNKQKLILKKANDLIDEGEATEALANLFEYETIIHYNLSEATLNHTANKEDLKKIEEKLHSLKNKQQATNLKELIADSENILTHRTNYQSELQDALDNSDDTNYLDKLIDNSEKNIALIESPRLENKINKQINKIKIKSKNIKKEKEEEQRLAKLKQQELDKLETEKNQNNNDVEIKESQLNTTLNDTQSEQTTENSTETRSEAEVVPEPEVEVAPRTDGINFNGYHFDIGWFGGSGGSHVPTWTPYIYRWSELPNLYLAEKQSDVGNAVWSLQIGSKIVVDGQTYTVYKYSNGVNNQNGESYNLTVSQGAPITIVTCETNNEWSLQSMWFAG
ncbi:hypothetical protein [Vagococcus xieshaowenii]|uniref:Uncharacterized protein n=1 Tax=Vagococcus xieshaowenii TaxID=2562451 RepID=A0AAJ5EFW1_9ENTE|nr:hypothetical protein [Vagococcus xieshaowenii]QCA28823.1 hypothetical protein E4Z98_05625 [Vagococcus xieshaowenii]TFZ42976.1 hypothetical protein E4031_01020 [Vagococcus xieshaowenii]